MKKTYSLLTCFGIFLSTMAFAEEFDPTKITLECTNLRTVAKFNNTEIARSYQYPSTDVCERYLSENNAALISTSNKGNMVSVFVSSNSGDLAVRDSKKPITPSYEDLQKKIEHLEASGCEKPKSKKKQKHKHKHKESSDGDFDGFNSNDDAS